MALLGRHGVGFRSITEAIDTTTPGGRLVFHLFGALGQFERDLIQERTRAGLAAAAVRGRKGGRKPVVDAEKLARARTIIGKGLAVREAAARLKVSKTALYDAIAQSKENRMPPSTRGSPMRSICSPWVMTTPCDHAIGSMVRDVWGPAQEILDTITVESILNAG